MPEEDGSEDKMSSETEDSPESPLYKIPNRKSGILTQRDREYLLDELDIGGQEERNLKYRMRQRVIASLIDLQLIGLKYPTEELRKVASELEESYLSRSRFHPNDIPLRGYCDFLVRWAKISGINQEDRANFTDSEKALESYLGESLSRWYRYDVPDLSLTDIDVIIATETEENEDHTMEELVDKVKRGDASNGEFRIVAKFADDSQAWEILNHARDNNGIPVAGVGNMSADELFAWFREQD